GKATLTFATVRVDGGGASPERLVLGGAGVVSGNSLVKIGAGELELGGTAPNTYVGTTTLNEGILRLNKSGGTQPASAQAIGTSNLVVGDNVGGDDADRVVDVSSFNLPHDVGGSHLTVSSTGRIDLNGQ